MRQLLRQLAAAHGVAKMNPPVVLGVNIAHGRCDAAFGHDGMRFAEQRLAYERCLNALR
jgi:hypothetical protein